MAVSALLTNPNPSDDDLVQAITCQHPRHYTRIRAAVHSLSEA